MCKLWAVWGRVVQQGQVFAMERAHKQAAQQMCKCESLRRQLLQSYLLSRNSQKHFLSIVVCVCMWESAQAHAHTCICVCWELMWNEVFIPHSSQVQHFNKTRAHTHTQNQGIKFCETDARSTQMLTRECCQHKIGAGQNRSPKPTLFHLHHCCLRCSLPMCRSALALAPFIKKWNLV